MKEIEFAENELRKLFKMIESTFHYEYLVYLDHPESEEYPGYSKEWLKRRIKDFYLTSCWYLEAKGAVQYLQEFQLKFRFIMDESSKNLLKTSIYHPDDDHGELEVLHNSRQWLDPFGVFGEQTEKKEDIIHLTGILRDTGHILKRMNIAISSETDISKHMRWFLGVYYSSVSSGSSPHFHGKFKSYLHDIGIPELKVGVEYKYLKKGGKNVEELIDEVYSDSVNYTGDSNYTDFLAVIYIDDIMAASQAAIIECWKSKKFPKNWKLILALAG